MAPEVVICPFCPMENRIVEMILSSIQLKSGVEDDIKNGSLKGCLRLRVKHCEKFLFSM
jgi:hypothetical protein